MCGVMFDCSWVVVGAQRDGRDVDGYDGAVDESYQKVLQVEESWMFDV